MLKIEISTSLKPNKQKNQLSVVVVLISVYLDRKISQTRAIQMDRQTGRQTSIRRTDVEGQSHQKDIHTSYIQWFPRWHTVEFPTGDLYFINK